jgi:hypothetical protein
VVIEVQGKRSHAVNLKTYLLPVQIGLPLANASKMYRIYGYSTLRPLVKWGMYVAG